MDQPSSGTIECNGVRIEEMTNSGLTRYRRESVGFVFQFYNLIPTLTAAENIGIASRGVGDLTKSLYYEVFKVLSAIREELLHHVAGVRADEPEVVQPLRTPGAAQDAGRRDLHAQTTRSEERRVGKECRSRWSPYH